MIASSSDFSGTADAKQADASELDNLLDGINSELNTSMLMSESSTPDLIVTLNSATIQSPETSKKRTSSSVPDFTGGTITFPSSSGGTITVATGDNLVLTISNDNFLKFLVEIDSSDNIVLTAGVESGTEAAATLPSLNAGNTPVGYIVLRTTVAAVQNLTNTFIYQFTDNSITPSGGTAPIVSIVNHLSDTDAHFETGSPTWDEYQDAAAAIPVDGTSGSPTVSAATNTSSPRRGSTDWKLTKDAADRQGEGWSVDFTTDIQDKTSTLQNISFDYSFTANYVINDAAVFVYDVTNANLITPNVSGIDASGRFNAHFNAATGSTSYRLIIHVATTNASAWDIQIDNVRVGPTSLAFGSVDTDWEAWTPTNTQGFGTISSSDLEWRRSGPDMQIRGSFTAGTTNSSEGQIELPNSEVIAGLSTTITNSGTWIRSAAVTANGGMILATKGDTYLNFGDDFTFSGSSTSAAVPTAGNSLVGAETVYIHASLPIEGWEIQSGDVVSQAFPENVHSAKITNTGSAAISSQSDEINPAIASVNRTGAGVVVITLTSGFYTVTPSVTATIVDGTPSVDIAKVTASSATSITVTTLTGASAATDADFGIVLQKQGADYQNPNLFSLLNNEQVVYIKEVLSSGTDGGTFTSGAWRTRTLNTVSGATHLTTLASDQFTLGPGNYNIEARAVGMKVGAHKIKLRNITDSTDDIIGMSLISDSGDNVTSTATLADDLELTESKTFELQHRCAITRSSDGFGQTNTFSVDEVYVEITIRKRKV